MAPYGTSARATTMSGLSLVTYWIYALFETDWNPTDVKTWMAWSLLPYGAETAGVRRGARTVVIDGGRAVNVCSGVLLRAGLFKTGGEPFVDTFSITG